MKYIQVSINDAIATLSLNRPEKHNALHQPMILELLSALKMLAHDDSRILIIQANGKNFCAGADIAWMQQIVLKSAAENYTDAQHLADLLYALHTFPKPTLVLTHGVVLGGGVGLVAAADIAIGGKSASFGFSEVKIGITPSIISPYIIAALGERVARYYILTGEKFSATLAQRLNLLHQVVEDDALLSVGLTLAQTIIQNSPHALNESKRLIDQISKEKISVALAQKTAEHLATIRATDQAQEGLDAFVQKRSPNWSKV